MISINVIDYYDAEKGIHEFADFHPEKGERGIVEFDGDLSHIPPMRNFDFDEELVQNSIGEMVQVPDQDQIREWVEEHESCFRSLYWRE